MGTGRESRIRGFNEAPAISPGKTRRLARTAYDGAPACFNEAPAISPGKTGIDPAQDDGDGELQ